MFLLDETRGNWFEIRKSGCVEWLCEAIIIIGHQNPQNKCVYKKMIVLKNDDDKKGLLLGQGNIKE